MVTCIGLCSCFDNSIFPGLFSHISWYCLGFLRHGLHCIPGWVLLSRCAGDCDPWGLLGMVWLDCLCCAVPLFWLPWGLHWCLDTGLVGGFAIQRVGLGMCACYSVAGVTNEHAQFRCSNISAVSLCHWLTAPHAQLDHWSIMALMLQLCWRLSGVMVAGLIGVVAGFSALAGHAWAPPYPILSCFC